MFVTPFPNSKFKHSVVLFVGERAPGRRAERDLGGEAAPHRVDPPRARGGLRRDGGGHEGGRGDRRVLLAEKGTRGIQTHSLG